MARAIGLSAPSVAGCLKNSVDNSSVDNGRRLNLHFEQRRRSSWLFRGRAMRGWPGACADVSVHLGVSWLAYHSVQYRCARVFVR